MANVANNSFRSRLAHNNANRTAPQGFHHNPQAFDDRVGMGESRKSYIQRNWHFLTPRMLRHADRLSSTYKGVPIDSKGQFGLALA